MGRDWNEGYNRNDLNIYDDLEDIKYTGKKKTKKNKPYSIEILHAKQIRFLYPAWRVISKYETKEKAIKALNNLVDNHADTVGISITRRKGRSYDNSVANIDIYLKGSPYIYYRIIKKCG